MRVFQHRLELADAGSVDNFLKDGGGSTSDAQEYKTSGEAK